MGNMEYHTQGGVKFVAQAFSQYIDVYFGVHCLDVITTDKPLNSGRFNQVVTEYIDMYMDHFDAMWTEAFRLTLEGAGEDV